MPDHDIMNIYQILDSMRDDLASIRATTTQLNRSVNGNGRPGLEQRVTVQEQLIISLSACVERHEKGHIRGGDKKLATVALIFSGLSSMAALLAVFLTVIG